MFSPVASFRNRFLAAALLAAAPTFPSDARDVPFVPTPPEVVKRMLELGEAGQGDTVIDLGSGDGRIVIAAVRDFNVDRAIGVDIDPQRIRESNENARAAGVEDKVEFIQGDLFQTDLSQADVLTMYLLSSVNLKLKPKILAEMRPGTKVVSHDFSMGDWAPDVVEKVNYRTVYMWTVPARVDGEWQVEVQTPQGPQHYAVDMDQEFQRFAGRAEPDQGESVAVRDGAIEGEQLSFVLDGGEAGAMLFQGEINGDSISGTVSAPDGAEMQWQAERGG